MQESPLSDAQVISGFLLLCSPDKLCVECISWMSHLPAGRVEAAIPALAQDVRFTATDSNCSRCLRDRLVLSVS